nr:hypothetical protein BaRGS_001404 [Batillaria attramentaria]
MWSNKISTIERAAFRNLSDFHALSFYLNNVTLIAPDAFDQIERFSKVEIYLNRFESIAMGSAYPLNRAAGHNYRFSYNCIRDNGHFSCQPSQGEVDRI